ncbi:hypothetical protein SAY86_006636 [Trapa natans]|uniref:Uncharacterized protein n=1 Tax=Trapa natans TaxID=22666 RepID=A0AAN7LA54_TRANT|nr:hypothetical protein SAY86_006636 [Trapa natans]
MAIERFFYNLLYVLNNDVLMFLKSDVFEPWAESVHQLNSSVAFCLVSSSQPHCRHQQDLLEGSHLGGLPPLPPPAHPVSCDSPASTGSRKSTCSSAPEPLMIFTRRATVRPAKLVHDLQSPLADAATVIMLREAFVIAG